VLQVYELACSFSGRDGPESAVCGCNGSRPASRNKGCGLKARGMTIMRVRARNFITPSFAGMTDKLVFFRTLYRGSPVGDLWKLVGLFGLKKGDQLFSHLADPGSARRMDAPARARSSIVMSVAMVSCSAATPPAHSRLSLTISGARSVSEILRRFRLALHHRGYDPCAITGSASSSFSGVRTLSGLRILPMLPLPLSYILCRGRTGNYRPQ
jgi:hypothetical protein